MTRLASILLLAAILAAPSPASAQDWEVGAGASLRHVGSPSLDPLAADDSHTAFALGFGRHLGMAAADRLQVSAGAQLEIGSIDGTTFQSLDAHTGLLTVLAGAQAHHALSPRWSALARAGLGLTRVAVELDAGGTGSLADQAWAGTAYLGAGIDLRLLSSLGLRAEVGYLATTPVELHAHSTTGPPVDPIPTVAASLGRLNVSAWTLRIGAIARF